MSNVDSVRIELEQIYLVDRSEYCADGSAARDTYDDETVT